MPFTNQQRAARVARLLRLYDKNDLPESCLIDILADARHWCDRNGQRFDDLDRQARDHYFAEVEEERGGAQ